MEKLAAREGEHHGGAHGDPHGPYAPGVDFLPAGYAADHALRLLERTAQAGQEKAVVVAFAAHVEVVRRPLAVQGRVRKYSQKPSVGERDGEASRVSVSSAKPW